LSPISEALRSGAVILGFILIIVGVMLVALPLFGSWLERAGRVHPLLLWGVRVNGFFIGTSPILIIALLLVYLFLTFWRA